MNRNEREHLAVQAISQIAAIANTPGFEAYGDTLQQKFIMLLCAVDQLSLATPSPLLITSLIEGVDLLVLRDPAIEQPKETATTLDIRSLVPADTLQIEMIGEVLARMVPVGAEGALTYQSDDGTVYVVFRSSLRHAVLHSMGISSIDDVHFAAPAASVLS